MSRDHREQRVGSRYLSRLILAVSLVFFLLLAIISGNIVTALPAERTTVVVAGDPVLVLSWDEARRRLTILPVPADVYLDGVFGVGSLPLASLRKLEALDTKKKGVFAASLADAFAIPISGVIDHDTAEARQEDAFEKAKTALSPFPVSGWWGSELFLPLRFRLWWILFGLRPDAVTTFDLGSQGVFRSDTLADGSQVRVFDLNRFDAVIANRLEVDAIRREELRVRVVNTTDIAGLGNRAARLFSHAGMVVVAVESEPPTQKPCTVHAKKERRESKTSTFIQRVFQCRVTQADTDERGDVTVRLGEEYAQRFTSD